MYLLVDSSLTFSLRHSIRCVLFLLKCVLYSVFRLTITLFLPEESVISILESMIVAPEFMRKLSASGSGSYLEYSSSLLFVSSCTVLNIGLLALSASFANPDLYTLVLLILLLPLEVMALIGMPALLSLSSDKVKFMTLSLCFASLFPYVFGSLLIHGL